MCAMVFPTCTRSDVADVTGVFVTGYLGGFPPQLILVRVLGMALCVLGAVAAGHSLFGATCDLRVVITPDKQVGREN